MSEKVITPKFRVSFPAVFEPRLNKLSKNIEYSIVMMFDKTSADLAKMKEAVKRMAFEKFGDQFSTLNLRSPFRDGDVERADRPEYKNIIFSNAKSKEEFKPGIVDEALNPLMDRTQFYAGCYARATINVYAYDFHGNRGVAFGLLNLQKMGDGESFTSKINAEDDFSPIETPQSMAEETTQVGDLFNL